MKWRKKLRIGEERISAKEAKDQGIEYHQMPPHDKSKWKGALVLDFLKLAPPKPKQEKKEDDDEDERPKSDPIARILLLRKKHKLREDPIRDAEAKQKKIPIYRAEAHKPNPKGRMFVDYLLAEKTQAQTVKAPPASASRSPTKVLNSTK